MADIKSDVASLKTSNTYIELTNYYAIKSIFSIIGDDRSEKVHSNSLAWIYRPEESHGLGNYPLQQLLLLLAKAKNYECNANSFLPKDYERAFLVGSYIMHSADVKREYNTGIIMGTKKGFIDILILLDITINSERKILPIIVENKVYSKENYYPKYDKKQTQLYHQWGKEKYSDENTYFRPIYVFLTVNRDVATQKDFININYQDMIDVVLSPCLKKNPSEQGITFIKNYLRCLSYSDIEVEGEKDYVMGITEDEKTLLKEFYEKNKALLSAVAECLQDDDELDAEEKEALGTFTKLINKDYTKYNFDGETNLSKRKLVLAIIKKYVSEHEGISLEDLKRVFPDNVCSSYGVFKERSKINNPERYFVDDTIILDDGTEIAVCNQWGLDNVEKIIEIAESPIVGYTVEKA